MPASILHMNSKQLWRVYRFASKIKFQNRFFSFSSRKNTSTTFTPFSKEHRHEFLSYYPLVVQNFGEQKYFDIEESAVRFRACMDCTLPNNELLSGLITVTTYNIFEKEENMTNENIKSANILGWCIELLDGAISILDDITTKSPIGRNPDSWYRKKGIALTAIADVITMNSSVFVLLRDYLSKHPYYVDMFDLFHEISLKVSWGKNINLIKYNPAELNMDLFNKLIGYKRDFYMYYFPVMLGIYLAKKYTHELEQQIAPLLKEMGKVFEIQNDINDCFSNPSTNWYENLKESRCTWLSVTAFQKANSSQRQIMQNHFGKPESKSVNEVLNLYKELDLISEFRQFKNKQFSFLYNSIDKLKNPQRELLLILLEKLRQQNDNKRQ